MKNCVGISLRGSKLRAASRREAHRNLPYGTLGANGILLGVADAPEAIAARIFQSGKCQNNLR
ncbi:hypothetical protein [uncultured Nostoc sp.]|uniref:hypothetical protein n=1 Tax=uncultured Nostoc sp. TaxID=340711 RepID=UPI00260C57F6|nr:hypothetical protein [uncultured Nostoc sp.]